MVRVVVNEAQSHVLHSCCLASRLLEMQLSLQHIAVGLCPEELSALLAYSSDEEESVVVSCYSEPWLVSIRLWSNFSLYSLSNACVDDESGL